MTTTLHSLLASHTVRDLALPSQLVTISDADNANAAFNKLMSHHVLGAPVVTSSGSLVGVVDMGDFVAYIVSLFTTDDFSANVIAELDKALAEAPVVRLINASGMNGSLKVTMQSSLAEVASQLVTHRRAVVVDDGDRVVNVITQSTVLKFIEKHNAQCAEALKAPASTLITSPVVVSVNEEATALAAFRVMAQQGVGSVAIVDEDGELITALSSSDIKGVAYGRSLSALSQTVMTFVAHVRQHSTTDMSPSISVHSDTPLSTVVAKLAATRVHRLFVLPHTGRSAVGVISLTDVCRSALTH